MLAAQISTLRARIMLRKNANDLFLGSGVPSSSSILSLGRTLVADGGKIPWQVTGPSCFHSASTGAGNANAAPEGGA